MGGRGRTAPSRPYGSASVPRPHVTLNLPPAGWRPQTRDRSTRHRPSTTTGRRPCDALPTVSIVAPPSLRWYNPAVKLTVLLPIVSG